MYNYINYICYTYFYYLLIYYFICYHIALHIILKILPKKLLVMENFKQQWGEKYKESSYTYHPLQKLLTILHTCFIYLLHFFPQNILKHTPKRISFYLWILYSLKTEISFKNTTCMSLSHLIPQYFLKSDPYLNFWLPQKCLCTVGLFKSGCKHSLYIACGCYASLFFFCPVRVSPLLASHLLFLPLTSWRNRVLYNAPYFGWLLPPCVI